jgi:hypothetical protein
MRQNLALHRARALPKLCPRIKREQVQRIHERTFTGRPYGDDAFVRKVELSLGRSLRSGNPDPKRSVRIRIVKASYGLPMRS